MRCMTAVDSQAELLILQIDGLCSTEELIELLSISQGYHWRVRDSLTRLTCGKCSKQLLS